MDVSDFEATCAQMLAIDREAQVIDLVVANAGIAGAQAAVPLDGCEIQEAKAILSVDMLGAVATLMPLIPNMKERGRGHLVGVTSLAVDAPNPKAAHYGASKAGLRYFLRCADIELRPLGIAVTEVIPGWVRTPAVEAVEEPMPMIWGMDRAAEHIAKGIHRRQRHIRFPWALQTLVRSSHAVMPRAMYDAIIRRMAKAPSTS
jgi:short-subunit dehydrogenase